jgi:hypothetical protein
VWNPPHDLNAINELMTEDYTITTAGQVVKGRKNFCCMGDRVPDKNS